MTATLTDPEHITLSPELDDGVLLPLGQEFKVMVSTSGVVMLYPSREPQRGLVESFAALRGLEFQHRRDPIPPPFEL